MRVHGTQYADLSPSACIDERKRAAEDSSPVGENQLEMQSQQGKWLPRS